MEETVAIQKKTYTYAEYADIISRPENANRILELIDGELVEKTASFTPSEIAMTIGFYFKGYLIENPIGYLTAADGGYILDDDNTFIPDVGYISKSRLPERPSREAPVAPDLAVEVKSPTDRKRDMRLKADKYLAFGTKMVWLVFPEDQDVEVYEPDKDVVNVGIDGILDGGTVLPGFQLPVRKIFPE